MIFSKRLGIECASSFNVSRVTFFHAKRSRLFSSFIVFGGWIFVRCLVNDIPDVLNGMFADQPFLAMKFGKCFWHHVWAASEVWAGALSWTNAIPFFELNNFLSIGPPVTWRLDVTERFHFFLNDVVDVVLRS